ncbi:MAG: hypothetical protein UE029_08745, partial [Christensenellales bacterium]|nr:hypothetical protein [Christensenellales bacterium]
VTTFLRLLQWSVYIIEALSGGSSIRSLFCLSGSSTVYHLHVPMVKDLLLRFGKMKAQLGQYQEAFTSVMVENERLKKENEKLDSTCRAYHSRDFSNMSAIQQLEQRCLRYEKQLSAIPAGVVARYSQQQRKAQKEVSERNY